MKINLGALSKHPSCDLRLKNRVKRHRSQVEITEIAVFLDNISRMKGKITVGLFKRVMQGYEFTGHNAEKLKAILGDPSKTGNALTYASFNDATEFARRLSLLTNRKFRVKTETEWLQDKDQLAGNYWVCERVEDKGGDYHYVSLPLAIRYYRYPDHRYPFDVVRIVEGS